MLCFYLTCDSICNYKTSNCCINCRWSFKEQTLATCFSKENFMKCKKSLTELVFLLKQTFLEVIIRPLGTAQYSCSQRFFSKNKLTNTNFHNHNQPTITSCHTSKLKWHKQFRYNKLHSYDRNSTHTIHELYTHQYTSCTNERTQHMYFQRVELS